MEGQTCWFALALTLATLTLTSGGILTSTRAEGQEETSEMKTQIKVDDGKAKLVTIEVKVLPVKTKEEKQITTMSTPSNCILMGSDDERWYKQCKVVEDEPGCYTITDCPTNCTGADGTYHILGGEAWPEKNDTLICRCTTVGSIFHFAPALPPGGQPIPPMKTCDTYGCTHPETQAHLLPSAVFKVDGKKCVCAEGPDTTLMDYGTLYHIECEGGEVEGGEVEGGEETVPTVTVSEETGPPVTVSEETEPTVIVEETEPPVIVEETEPPVTVSEKIEPTKLPTTAETQAPPAT